MNPFHIRLQALDWLFAATEHWLFQDRNSVQPFPREDHRYWKTVGDLAYVHNVEPLLHWMISNTEHSVKIPEWLTQKWEQAYFGNFLRNEEYLGILKGLLQECETAGIPIIVLKGPALIGRIYKDPALRTLSDLDIFCSRGDLPGIINISRRMGYTLMDDGDDPAAAHHVAMVQAATILEFHFLPYEVIQNHTKFMQLAWDRRECIHVGGIQCPVLSLEMELLFNIAHLVQHQFDASLKHFLDIAGLLVFCSEKLKWDDIALLLGEFGLEQAFAVTTGFISTVMGLPRISHAPPLFNLQDSAQQKFEASLRIMLALLDEDRLLDVRGAVWRFRIAVKNREGFSKKVEYAAKVLLLFSGSLADHGFRSSGNSRYFLHQCRFYLKRLLLTLKNLPEKRLTKKQPSPAVERADAKSRITRQLMKIARLKHSL